MKQKAHIGQVIADKLVLIEQGLVERFVDALEIDDPRSIDLAAAKAAGLTGLMLPTVAAGCLGEYDQAIDALELKPKQVLHSRENILLHQPVCVGDELQITTTIQDLYEQQGGGGNPMGFVAIEVTGVTKKGVVAFEVQRVLAVRGGFPRR